LGLAFPLKSNSPDDHHPSLRIPSQVTFNFDVIPIIIFTAKFIVVLVIFPLLVSIFILIFIVEVSKGCVPVAGSI
jgi:hypothetical protein